MKSADREADEEEHRMACRERSTHDQQTERSQPKPTGDPESQPPPHEEDLRRDEHREEDPRIASIHRDS